MITCTRCGGKNADDNRFCEQCGNKLQSLSRAGSPVELSDRPSDPLTRIQNNGKPSPALARMFEAWIYILLLTVAAAICAWKDVWWPLYPTVAVIGIVAWLRKI
ncbi:zinc-ribbon domain-containing protein [Pseudodesulfovibrio sp.]|uniref:zinc-ribbon domain-containing protein n=1 Tax=unclassified Pseudodesulfovibrio TaxID=2661612 RepID=UPI003B000A36